MPNPVLVGRVFANAPGDSISIPSQVIPKTQKMVLDASLHNTQYYKVRIKGRKNNPGKGIAPPQHLGVVAIDKEAFESPLTTVGQLTSEYIYIFIFFNRHIRN